LSDLFNFALILQRNNQAVKKKPAARSDKKIAARTQKTVAIFLFRRYTVPVQKIP